MVRRVLQMVFSEVRGLHQAAYVLAVFTFASQVLALIRDRLLAAHFGASQELDLYYSAFKIPDLLFVLFASSLSVYVLIPFVARARDAESVVAARTLLGQVFSVFLVVYSVLALVVALSIPYLIPYLFPGLIDSAAELTQLIRILLLQPFLLGLSSLLGVVTQLSHRFILYAISPLLYNIGIIFGIVALYPEFGLSGIVYGVVLGAVAHLVVQIPFVQTSELRFGIQSRIDLVQLRSILAVSLPRAFTLSLTQLTLLFLVGFASLLSAGSIAVFQFAHNLFSVPLAIIGVSYSVAAFPILAELYAKNDMATFRLHVNSALRHIIFWAVPAIALIIVLRAQLVRVVLGAGAFDWTDTRLTAAVLAVLAIALVAQAVSLLFIRALYAGGNTRTPLVVGLGGLAATVSFTLGIYELFKSSEVVARIFEGLVRAPNVAGSEVLVIAFAFTLSSLLQAVWLGYAIVDQYEISLRWVRERLVKSVTAATVAGVVAYGALNFLVFGIDDEAFVGILLQGMIAGICGLITCAAMYALLKMPEYFEVLDTVKRRVFKTANDVTSDEVL